MLAETSERLELLEEHEGEVRHHAAQLVSELHLQLALAAHVPETGVEAYIDDARSLVVRLLEHLLPAEAAAAAISAAVSQASEQMSEQLADEQMAANSDWVSPATCAGLQAVAAQVAAEMQGVHMAAEAANREIMGEIVGEGASAAGATEAAAVQAVRNEGFVGEAATVHGAGSREQGAGGLESNGREVGEGRLAEVSTLKRRMLDARRTLASALEEVSPPPSCPLPASPASNTQPASHTGTASNTWPACATGERRWTRTPARVTRGRDARRDAEPSRLA